MWDIDLGNLTVLSNNNNNTCLVNKQVYNYTSSQYLKTQSCSIFANPLLESCFQQYKSRFSRHGRVSLNSAKFSPVIFDQVTSRDLRALPQSWSICSSPLLESCLQQDKFRFSNQVRVILNSLKFSPVIFV